MSVQIEMTVETALRTALATALDANAKSKGVRVNCAMLAPETLEDRPSLTEEAQTREAVVPGVWVTAKPYVPEAGMSADDNSIFPAGRVSITVIGRVNPSEDLDGSLIAAVWAAIVSVVYNGAYTITGNGVEVSGRVITGSDSGMDPMGQMMSVTSELAISLTA